MSKKPSNISSGFADFGFERVPEEDKASRVRQVFDAVTDRYDLMNDLMSLGSHRLLKRLLVEVSAVRSSDKVLDLAGGTGDLAMLFSDHVGPEGRVMLADINASMLHLARDRMLNKGYAGIHLVQADAEQLPLPDGSLNLVSMAFGLRNLTHKEKALAEIYRCLSSGGRLLVLEFSTPKHVVTRSLFRFYSSFWPLLGQSVVGQAQPYRYLVESISLHPNQEALKMMFADAGFADVRYHNFMDGVAALHIGYKP